MLFEEDIELGLLVTIEVETVLAGGSLEGGSKFARSSNAK